MALATRVGQRVEGRTPAPPASARRVKLALPVALAAQTPTPSPVEVAAFDEPPPPTSRRTRRTRATTRALVAALVFAVCILGWTHRTVSYDATIESAANLLSFAERARDGAVETGLRLDGLVFQGQDVAMPASGSGSEGSEGAHKIRREGHVSIPGGILVLPSTFQPAADGTYDLLVHFHGNTAVVRESAEVAGLNAAVAIVNLGIGSAPYEEYYNVGGTYEELLAAVDEGVRLRGVKNASLGRVALSAWSAGYGAVSSIMVARKGGEHLDAVLILDGIHGSLDDGKLNALQMRPFTRVAERAAKGELYFGITHSEIDPIAYAGTSVTADYMIAAADTERAPLDPERDAPAYLSLESMKGAVSKQREKKMEPTSEARIGTFHVIGYKGETKEHHMAHLFQMGATLLPELVARWSVGR